MAKKRKGGRNRGRANLRNAHLLEGKKPEMVKENGQTQYVKSVAPQKLNEPPKPDATKDHPKPKSSIQKKVDQIIAAKEHEQIQGKTKFQDRFKSARGIENRIQQIISQQQEKSAIKTDPRPKVDAPEPDNKAKQQTKPKAEISTPKQAQSPQNRMEKGIKTVVENIEVKQVVKVVAPLVGKLLGKYGPVVTAAGSLAMELTDELKNKGNEKAQTKNKEGQNERIQRLKSSTSLSTPSMSSPPKSQDVSKSEKKQGQEKLSSLKKGLPEQSKSPKPTKKPPSIKR